jgi:hypothetical protein
LDDAAKHNSVIVFTMPLSTGNTWGVNDTLIKVASVRILMKIMFAKHLEVCQ